MDTLKKQRRSEWKQRYERAVNESGLNELLVENRAKSKTKDLTYTALQTEPYILEYPSETARMIFRVRKRQVPCKSNMKTSHKDLTCRLCQNEEENQQHIVNCPKVRGSKEEVNIDMLRGDIEHIQGDLINDITHRIELFQEHIEHLTDKNNTN